MLDSDTTAVSLVTKDAMRRQIKVLTDDLETKSEAEKIQSARWQAASSVLEEALLLIDSELNLLYANPIAVQIFGDISDSGVSIVSYTHSEEFESECRGVVSGETDEELYEWQSEFQDSVLIYILNEAPFGEPDFYSVDNGETLIVDDELSMREFLQILMGILYI